MYEKISCIITQYKKGEIGAIFALCSIQSLLQESQEIDDQLSKEIQIVIEKMKEPIEEGTDSVYPSGLSSQDVAEICIANIEGLLNCCNSENISPGTPVAFFFRGPNTPEPRKKVSNQRLTPPLPTEMDTQATVGKQVFSFAFSR